MTKSAQQIADELARKCADWISLLCDSEDAGHFITERKERLSKKVLNTIPLLELLEVARAVKPSLEGIPDEDLFPEQRALLDALTNLQKKVIL